MYLSFWDVLTMLKNDAKLWTVICSNEELSMQPIILKYEYEHKWFCDPMHEIEGEPLFP